MTDCRPLEKKLIAGAADKYGARTVAQAYGLKWQTVIAWKKHYGDKAAMVTMATMSALKNGTKKSAVKIIIQSPAGQEVTVDELLEKIGKSAGAAGATGAASAAGASGANEATEVAVDTVYIHADEGKAYWVREIENGAVELW